MAAFLRPHMRSSSRRSESLDELPPTVIQQNSSDNTRLGKHPLEPSVKANEARSIKKQKLHSKEPLLTKDTSQNLETRPSPTFGAGAARHAETYGEQLADTAVVQPGTINDPTAIANGTRAASENNENTSVSAESSKQSEKRTLRSQAGSFRSKSELSWYFSNYDEIVNDEPREPEFLTPQTRIQIIDEPVKAPKSGLLSASPIRNALNRIRAPTASDTTTANGTGPTDDEQLGLNGAQRIELPTSDLDPGVDRKDALDDELYAKAHRRAERQEKQLRNIEKERAMHEKAQLERLLDSLKGHDWLKVMGISGVTDSDKKSWEPKRDYFIREVEILLEKFREWKEEEKRRKTEREERLLAEEEDGEEDEEEDETPIISDDALSDSDVDACAARQLHREAVSATGRRPRRRKAAAGLAKAPPIQKPFISFYDKPHLREAALGKHRRGRTRLAFGQVLPDVTEKAFGLPQDILTQDALRASARSRRAARRESKA